ncbi:SDR family oxidoreductase [Granulicella arctica]|uniref:NAD(P)-dependent dehydrogenase (Short-subunit alcohol dehydrogenase family) n=1 Tax=Granulicella arctica TaxID=940613 RepID=A0A7Y9PG92_9BACT|nr:SDR family oxidoreductase [Granulicella arctica]NYF78588.1 NAD(P)-dependent dehydrogenase (short-subunit alcohol dehydrogenase family) [Granulicella arctica]
MEKLVLITGANKGIGFEATRQLARAGFTVLLGARDTERGEEAADKLRGEGLDVRFVSADLNRAAESGAALAKQIGEEFGHLDVLINNAGICDREDGPASSVGLETLRRTFETNFFGAVAFTQPLLPLLRAAESARIVNVSSGLGSLAVNGDSSSLFYPVKILAYNASKAALNMFTVDLAYDLRDTRIKVNSVSPGFVATDMTNHRGTHTVEEGVIEIVRLAQLPDDGPTGGFTNKEGMVPW